jgi:hypothetical protein
MSAAYHEGWLLAGRYRLLTELGQGGMGRVWRGHDELLDRPVAVKEVSLHQQSQQEREAVLARTMREARLAARLSHPHIAGVHDVVVADERPWIVMQLVSAPTLAGVLARQGPLPAAVVARIGLQVLNALAVAHAAGIMHRDVKPANILLQDGHHAVLTDFGLATTVQQPAGLTQTGMVVGTPAYIAPERARGGTPGPQADLWSLGVTLYTAVEGRPPFGEGNALATLTAVLTADPAPFERAGPLAPLIAGLLAKDPERRTGLEEARRHLRRVTAPYAGHPPATEETAGAAAVPPSLRSAGAAAAPPPLRSAGAPSGRTRPNAAERRRLPARARHAAAAVIVGLLAVTFWTADRSGLPSPAPAGWRPEAGTATEPATPPVSSPSASPGILRAERVAVSRSPAARRQAARPPITGGTGSRSRFVPPGQAKKAAKTGKGHHKQHPKPRGKGRGAGRK